MLKLTDQNARKLSWWHWIIVAVVLAVMFVPVGFVLLSIAAVLINPFGNEEPVPIDPSISFSQLTEWTLPAEAEVITNHNTHRGFNHDGDYTLVVRLNPATLRSLVESDRKKWADCPISPEIEGSARSIPMHSGELYYARKTSSADSDWHRGHVVIVNRETGMVWVYEWKI